MRLFKLCDDMNIEPVQIWDCFEKVKIKVTTSFYWCKETLKSKFCTRDNKKLIKKYIFF